MKTWQKQSKHLARFEQLLRDIFAELGEFESLSGNLATTMRERRDDDPRNRPAKQTYRFDVKVRERITPQIADDLFERFEEEPLPDRVVRIVYAPVISPRVAEIARQHGISFIDYAGNCQIVDPNCRAADLAFRHPERSVESEAKDG